MKTSLWLTVALAVAAALPGARARAQVMVWITTTDGAACVDAAHDCTDNDACTMADTGSLCRQVQYSAGGEPRSACVADGALFCCGQGSPCPTGAGRCILRGDPAAAGVCVSPDPSRYCGTTTSDVRIIACHSMEGAFPLPYSSGDCDGDLVGNGQDDCPCEPGTGGDGCPDADAGPQTGPDGGVEPEQDAGPAPPPGDGGQGAAGGDGGTPLRFEGGGGCSCRTSAPAGAPVGLVLGLIAVLGCRRARRM